MSGTSKIFFGYLVVFTLILTSFIPLSFGLSCAGIFYPSVAETLNVEVGILSYYTSILWISTIIFLPIFGRLLGKLDARLCLTGAVVLVALDFLWLSMLHHVWQFYVGAFVMGISVTMLLFLAPSTLINRWFAKRSGFYIGLVMAFTGIGGVVWSSVGGVLIQNLGWQTTYLIFGGITVLTIPFTLFCTASRPSDKGLLPYGMEPIAKGPESPQTPEEKPAAVAETGLTAKEAYRTPVFYLLILMTFTINFGMYVYFIMPSYIGTLAIGIAIPLLGATASSAAMAGQTISKIVLGAVGDKHPGPASFVGVACGIVGVIILGLWNSAAILIYAAAFIYGFFYGVTNVMMPIMTRHSFGNREYPAIYSRISMGASLGGVLSGFIWGTVVSKAGFNPVLIGVCVILVITLITIVLISRYQKKHPLEA